MSPYTTSQHTAGTEGIKVWDIKSRKELTCSTHNESQGTETCTRRLGSGFKITFGTRDKIVQVLALNTNSQLEAIFAVRLDNTVLKSVAFADNKGVYVFGVYDGNFIKLKGDDSAVLKEYSCQSVIGHVAVNQKRGIFVVDNATDSISVPKQVAFGAEGRLVVGGSDNGLVYIFERKSGKLLETLHHSNAGLVQMIATRDISRHCIVVSGLQALGWGKATVNLWVYDYAMKKETLTLEKYWSLSHDTISADLAQRMRHTQAFFINDLQESVHKAVFDKVLHGQEEVQGDVGEDVHEKSAIDEKDDMAAEAERYKPSSSGNNRSKVKSIDLDHSTIEGGMMGTMSSIVQTIELEAIKVLALMWVTNWSFMCAPMYGLAEGILKDYPNPNMSPHHWASSY
ncbi:hypothetical protein BD769DRAFT_1394861 [Suillus cothurnatus]|nr:hypothetical protein BD769DRAFT_1394861 [Suillus cothurnatus]